MAKRQSGRVKKSDEEKNGKRYIVTLSGFAVEIWEALPRGVRNVIMSRLLEEAHRCGRLDLILTRPLREPEAVGTSYSEQNDSLDVPEEPIKGLVSEREASARERAKSDTEKKETDSPREASEEPDWLQDLDRKISRTINL